MIDRAALLVDLQALLKRLEADLLERSESDEVPDVGRALHAEFERARQAERTAANFEDWRSDTITQTAAAWVLSCVFVRFLEDNRLIDPPRISGPKERLQIARDEHEIYFRKHARQTDRDYLLAVFDELAELPGTKDVFGEHNPIRELPNWLSGDAAGEMLRFFQKIVADTGELVHDFTDLDWDTRFLGDLYQDLSEAARKKYALLQTPEFVEEFILDRTLEPALDEFGLVTSPQSKAPFKMIDPACGSGHFLLGAFGRILGRWQQQEPGGKIQDLVQKTLDSIHGVDVNPFAVAIARFRLLLAAMRACGVMRLADAPRFQLNLACGDSLYHGRQRQQMLGDDWTDEAHYFAAEDAPTLRRMLRDGTYHCVVANPPYITPKDRAANQTYRRLYPKTCHRQYSLAVPFMERLFRLAVQGALVTGHSSLVAGEQTKDQGQMTKDSRSAGFVGQITANSFMKREFGKKLIEAFLPQADLTHVIDTSGAYIPGHGTPTVILFGRNRQPVASTIRTAMGIRGEPSTPDDPSQGQVWTAIVDQLDRPGSQSEFVSVGDSQRDLFHKHPWSIGGGGAAELKERLEESALLPLSALVNEIGVLGMTNADDVMLAPRGAFSRKDVEFHVVRGLALGDAVRDWLIGEGDSCLFPYLDGELISIDAFPGMKRWLWPTRSVLGNRATFARLTYFQEGRAWWEWHQIALRRLHTPLSIVYGEVATHNHFVLDRGGKVFNRTAPVIKLPAEASEDDHLALLGLLNSSTACFWMKQVCHQKQMMGGDGIRIESKAKVPYAFNATALGKMPIPQAWVSGPLREHLLHLTRRMDQITQQHSRRAAKHVLSDGELTAPAIRRRWEQAVADRQRLRAEQVFLQEQIDFTVYRMFDLVADDLLGTAVEFTGEAISEGERPFCILASSNEDGFPVPQAVSDDWPGELQQLWSRRIESIRNNRELRLIESSMYKRRWIGRQGLFNHQRSDDELGDAARSYLLDRLESYFDFDGRMSDESEQHRTELGQTRSSENLCDLATLREVSLVSVAQLADVAARDPRFMEVGEIYRDDPAFDVLRLVAELVAAETVPLLPVLRYKPSGLRKRAQWEKTWSMQREEDEIDSRVTGSETKDQGPMTDDQGRHLAENLLTREQADQLKKSQIGEIPVPPKYTSADFISSGGARYWALRGKLDVPKERWISFPHCEGPDGTLMIAWAGYDHLQRARAISAYYVEIQEHLGGRDDPRLVPLLACVIELLPWLRQWHHDIDPDFDQRMDEFFEGFVAEEAKALNRTIDEVKAWEPPKRGGGRRRKAD